MAHAYNPSTLGGRGGWITRSRDQDNLGQHGETLSLLKIQQLAGHGGMVLVVPATQEAEAVSCDCTTALSLGDRARPHLKKKLTI